MAEANDVSDQDAATGQPATFAQRFSRDALGWLVVVLGAGGIILLALVVIYLFHATEDVSEKVFAAVVPLFGTWVGTVLAYYFSRENFQAANASVRQAIDKLTPDQKLQQTGVREAYIPRNKIKGVDLTATVQEKDVQIEKLCILLDEPNVTRLPIFAPNGSIKYIIHESMLYKFISDRSLRKDPVVPTTSTLEDFLVHKSQDGTEMRGVVTRIAFVAPNATLAEARDRMSAVAGAQDVIVTATGKPNEPVEGWLPNSEIMKVAGIQ
jgi:hypothetical protein